MSHLRDWENSLRFGRHRSKKGKDAAAVSCKYVGHNLHSPHQKTCNRFEVKRKTDVLLNCNEYTKKNRYKIKGESAQPTENLKVSNLTVEPPCCLEEELEESTIVHDFATYLKAFALIYVLPEEEWKAENIDKLLVEGEELFQASSDNELTDKPVNKTSIYNSMEQRIKRSFKLEGHNFTLELKPPYMGDRNRPADLRPPHILKNLKRVLRSFFLKAYYCLLLHKAGYLLLWRRRKLFFVMDVKGRRSDEMTCSGPSVAMLMCLQSLDGVVQLVTSLSGDNPNGAFRIRELAVVRLVTPDGRTFLRNTNKRSLQYHMINNSYAYLKSNLHLSLNPEATLRNSSSIIVGVASIVAASIDHPASWNTYMYDRLICYGVELCRYCWRANVQDRVPIDLDTFPTQVRLGQFVAEIKLLPKYGSGRWCSAFPAEGNEFEFEIFKALREFGNCLFQISNQTYAMWRKDEFYYVMDPYRHIVVSPNMNMSGVKLAKMATVRMFRDATAMLNVFHQQLKESNRKSKFEVHVVRIKNIAKCPPGYALKPVRKNEVVPLPELNESIEFPEKLERCEQLLVEVSDYEPDVASTEDGVVWEDCMGDYPELQQSNTGVEEVQIETIKRTKPFRIENDHSQSMDISIKNAAQLGIERANSEAMNTERFQGGFQSSKSNGGLTDDKLALMENRLGLGKKLSNVTQLIKSPEKPLLYADKISTLDAEICANYRPINISQFPVNACEHCLNGQRHSSDALFNPGSSGTMLQKSGSIAYPVYTKYPYNLAIAGSESGTVESLNRLLDSAFSITNRVFTITPWGNFVVFQQPVSQTVDAKTSNMFYLFDGCTCNIDRFRHLDLSHGTAGLLPFQTQSQVVCYMIDSRETKAMRTLRLHGDASTAQSGTCPGRGT